MSITSCRICLRDGAKIPIFDDSDTKNDILSKLTLCLNEKIEDIDGYPRNICVTCTETVEGACEFIRKFKETCHILQNNLLVKLEHITFSDNSCFECDNEVEVEIDNIKKESSNDVSLSNRKQLEVQKEKEASKDRQFTSGNNSVNIKKKDTLKRPNHKSIKGTNKIASSILEGEFLWIGDTWCIKPAKKTPPVKKNIRVKSDKTKKSKIILPKVKKPDPPKLCDICGEIFKSAEKLSKHKNTIHYKKIKKCPHCPRILSSDYHFRAHCRRVHQTDKEFVCATCGKGFAFKGELASHNKVVHNKHLLPKKQYTCKICDKVYKCAKSVLIHERSVHTGQRPAVCAICDSSFYHEDYLKEHMRLHTGETPFKCPVCGRGYAQRGNMKSHLRIHKLSEIDANILSKIRPNYLKLLKP